MSMTFYDIQREVKRRATVDRAGTNYDIAIKSIINASLRTISRSSPWRSLRRTATITTRTSYSTGTATVTNASKNVSISGATLITNNVEVGRFIKFSGSATYYTIASITSETTLTLTEDFDGTSSSTNTYSVLPQRDYNLPPQVSHRMFMVHKRDGYPRKMEYVAAQEQLGSTLYDTELGTPDRYYMWGESMSLMQPRQASVLSVSSSATADNNINITIFGTVAGYPDHEVITTNATDGTTVVNGTKSFSRVERIVKDASTTGRITVTANTAADTIGVIPTGIYTLGMQVRTVSLYPLPDSVFNIDVYYYKETYDLVENDDVHELGSDFDEAIILLSVSKLKAEQEQASAGDFYSMYREELRLLREHNADKPDYSPSRSRPYAQNNIGLHPYLSYSQIGPYYGPTVR